MRGILETIRLTNELQGATLMEHFHPARGRESQHGFNGDFIPRPAARESAHCFQGESERSEI